MKCFSSLPFFLAPLSTLSPLPTIFYNDCDGMFKNDFAHLLKTLLKNLGSKFIFHFSIRFYLFACVSVYMCAHRNMPQNACRNQRTTCISCFSPLTMWVLGIKCRLSSLVASMLPSKPLNCPKVCIS